MGGTSGCCHCVYYMIILYCLPRNEVAIAAPLVPVLLAVSSVLSVQFLLFVILFYN